MRAALLAALLIAAPARADDGADWAGHYYLSGVMETGSELLLRADGSYDWYISYGAVDQFSKGVWRRDGGEIILRSSKPAYDKPAVSLDVQEPWTERAEMLPQREVQDAAVARVLAACPFISQESLIASAPSVSLMSETSTAVDVAAFEKALAAEKQARSDWEEAARRAVADTTLAQQAMNARAAWSHAETDLREAAQRAGKSLPDLPAPVLPPACTIPPPVDPATIDRARWIGGHGVVVGDPVRGYRLSDVGIRFRYDDGQVVDRKTTPGGWAWVPKRAGQAVRVIQMRWPESDRLNALPDVPMNAAIPPDTIQPLRVDSDRLVPPPFTEMRLRISGRELIGFNGRGRYERPPGK